MNILEKSSLAASKAEYKLQQVDNLTKTTERLKRWTIDEVAEVTQALQRVRDDLAESICKHTRPTYTNLKMDRLQVASSAIDDWKDVNKFDDMAVGKKAIAANDAGSAKGAK